MLMRLQIVLWLVAMPVLAQTNNLVDASRSNRIPDMPPGQFQSQTNSAASYAQYIAKIREGCIQNRRTVCGKILKILPEGMVIDSGYTNLMRSPLNRSWLVPGTVPAERATNLVEENRPECVCVGLVFVTDLPKKPIGKVYDYVNLTAFPTGHYTYTSVGDLQRTVRRYSTKLAKSVQSKLDEAGGEKQNPQLK
jgi:hypothetical protein